MYENNSVKSEKFRKPVNPNRKIIPSKIKRDAKEPTIKYLIADSIE
jgi:hypothetical protein